MCCVYWYMFDVGFKQTAPHGYVWCCRHAPFLIAFQERAQVFTTVVGQDRMEQREMGMRGGYGWGRQYFVTIHRTTLLQVSIITMSDLEYSPHSSHQTGLLSRARAYDPEDSRNDHGDSHNDPWDSRNDTGDTCNDWVAVGKRGKLSKQVLPSCLLSFPLLPLACHHSVTWDCILAACMRASSARKMLVCAHKNC